MDIERVRSLIGTRLKAQSLDSVATFSIIETYLKKASFPFQTTSLKYHNLQNKDIYNLVKNISNFTFLSMNEHSDECDVYGLYDNLLIRFTWHKMNSIVYLYLMGGIVFPNKIKAYFESQGFSLTSDSDEKQTPILFGMMSAKGVETKTKYYTTLKFDEIKNNYAPETQIRVENLIEKLKYESHGLIILHGPVGTGKTYLIRSILSELNKHRKGIICVPPLAFLENIYAMLEVSWAQNNPLIVFEDMGEIFQKDAKVTFTNHFSNLANLSDGLLSMLGNSVFLMTFNYEIAQLDPAMTRAGRCIANINVPRLSIEYARKIVPAGVKSKLTQSTYSLAELYALRDGKQIESVEKNPMGFLRNTEDVAVPGRGFG